MPCPSPEMLTRYESGALALAEAVWVEDHARVCESCGPLVALRPAAQPAIVTATLWPSEQGTGPAPPSGSGVPSSGVSAVDRGVSEPIADAPATVGPYVVEGVLGKGGMGVVYRARHPETGRLVAVKTVAALRRAMMAGLRDEISFLKDVRHPGVVEIFDYDVTCEVPWYAMELLEGPTLATWNRELWGAPAEVARLRASGDATLANGTPGTAMERPMAAGGRLADVLTFYSEVCVPLRYVHRAGIVHCDLKPENVFLRPDGRPVLADFGLISKARGAVGRESLTPVQRVRGTLPYIAPEVIEGRIADARADLYSLGCMLYETVSGAPPFWSANQSQLLRMHVETEPKKPSARVTGVDGALDELILGLLAKLPRDRMNDIDEVAEALRSLGGALTSQRRPRKSAFLFRPHLAGRDEAVTAVLERCRRASTGTGSLIFVEGESGIGKTFFANEISQRAAANAFHVLAGEAVTVRAGDGADAPATSLQLFMSTFEWLRDHCQEHGSGETDRLLGANARLLGEIVPALGRVPGADVWPAPAPLPAAAARERHVRAVLEIVARLSETQPLLLTLDDVQWADDLSIAVLEAMSENFVQTTPVVVLIAYRSEEMSEALRQLSSRAWAERIPLRRLSAVEVGAVVRDMLSSAQLESEMIDYVHAQSEGVPFFVAEYLRAMMEEGVLQRAAGKWRLAEGSSGVAGVLKALPVPGALMDIVRRRLSRLPADCLSALEAGAVLGRRFRLQELEKTTSLDVERLMSALARAVEHRLLEAEAQREYRFPHDKIRETLYADIALPRRGELHAAAGTAICDLFREGEGLEERYGIVAHHFRRAGMMARAVPFLARAGARALQLSATSDAVVYLRDALSLESSLEDRVDPLTRASWCRMLGQSLQGLGRIEHSIDPLREAMNLLGAGGRVPTGGARFFVELLREIGIQVGRRLRKPRARLPLPPGELELGHTLEALTQGYFYAGENVGFMLAALATLNVFEDGPPTPELGLAYGHAAATVAFVVPALSPRYFELADATLRQLENPSTESHVEMLHGLTCTVVAQRDEADRHLVRSLDLAERASHYRRWDECASVRASYLTMIGAFAEADDLLKKLEASTRLRDDVQIRAWSFLMRGQWAIRLRNAALAAEAFAGAERLSDRLATADRIWLTAQGALTAKMTGDFKAARLRLQQASVLIAGKPPPQPHLIDAMAMFAETWLGLAFEASGSGTSADLIEARCACALLGGTARMQPLAKPRAHLHLGTYQWKTGRARAARRTWQRGLAIAETLHFRIEEGLIRAKLADAVTDEDERRRHRARADEIARALGIPPDLPHPAIE